MISKKQWIVGGVLLSGICFLIGLLGTSQLPKIRALVLVKIEQVSREHLPVRILPGAVDLSIFPLSATVYDVRILPKEEFKPFLQSAAIDKVRVRISPLQLLRGRIRLTEFDVSGAKVAATIPPSQKKSGSPLHGAFDMLTQLPINRLSLKDVSANLLLQGPKLRVILDNVDLETQKKRGNSLSLEITSGSAQILDSTLKETATLKASVEADLLASRNLIEVDALKVRRGDSYVSLQGHLKGDVEELDFKEIKLNAKSELNLESMGTWVSKTFARDYKTFPVLQGRAILEAKAVRKSGSEPEADFTASTSGLKIGKFFVDKVSTTGKYQVRDKVPEVLSPKLVVENPAGTASLQDLTLRLGEKKMVSGRLNVGTIQIHELLKSLGIGEIPVFMQLSGDLPCSGEIAPDLSIDCKGKARGENLLVRGSMDAKGTIAAIRQFDAGGEVKIDKEKVSYSTELAMPQSKGRSSGVISYASGFKIDYEGDKVAISDLTNLADLKLEGTARVKGSTEGNSEAASLALTIDGTDFWLEDFWLGNAKGNVTYKEGQLGFGNMSGYYTVSRYTGDVRLDLHKKEINVTGRIPFFDARDLLKVFSRRVKLPFAVTGTGQAQIKASGPLKLNLLSYDLKSSLFRGTVASETFDQANFDVKSVGGEVKTERAQALKGGSSILLSGVAHPDGTIKTLITGHGLKLEDSVIVSGAGLALSGLVDFDMDMSGPVLAPDTDMRGRLTKTSIGDEGVADSNFRLKFGSKLIEGSGAFLGDVMKASFKIPLDASSPFALKLDSNEWNYAPLFAAIAGPASRKDYEGRLSASIDLASPSGGFWNATGQANVSKFLLARGALQLKNSEPLLLKMKNGQVQAENVALAGENIFLKVTTNPHPVSKLDLQVNGKLDMTLLGILTPFFEDLRGILSFAFNLRGGPEGADVLGSAYVERGFLKFFDFPHPLEDIQLDVLFNQKKILFNTVKASFGGGRIAATGGMELKGYKNYPVNVAGTFEKVTLNIPDKVRTTGSGNISFAGSWFPFLLKADYDVKDGLVTKEFGGDGNDSAQVRRDQFLPELLLQERFVPVVLDLDINFMKGLQVKNDLLDGRVTGALAVKGNPTKPSILGQVFVDKGSKLAVKDTTFEVQNANIQLNDPNEINPKLYLTARARVQDYDVNLLVQGTGSKPEFGFTSVPPLADKDIISLLALGTTDQSINPVLQQNPQQAQQGPQASVGALKNNPLSKEIKDKTGFDLQFAPGFDERAAVQKIIVSRQFSNKFGVSASQSLGNKRSTEAELRYRINEKVSAIGSWQNRDDLNTIDKVQSTDKEQNQLGLDLEYKFEFK